jgi:hypothetical protein
METVNPEFDLRSPRGVVVVVVVVHCTTAQPTKPQQSQT